MVSVGVILGQEDSNFDINSFKDLEELRNFLNDRYDADIKRGMLWVDVLKHLKNKISDKRYADTMKIF